MYHLHVTRNLRTLVFLLILSAVIGLFGVLWWANSTGLPEPWREMVEKEVSKQGAHIKIGSVRYALFKGIVATDVRVFSEPEHLREISRLEQIILDIDVTKLARGEVHMSKIELADARLFLPVDPKDPDSDTLNVTGAYGTIFLPGNNRIEVRGARGKIAGIEVDLDARLVTWRHDGPKPPDDENVGKRRELLARVIDELEKWHFREDSPPKIRISVEGDLNHYSSIVAKLALEVKDMEQNGHVLDEVSAEADMAGDLLTISSLKATDSKGEFEGHIDYNLFSREGRFDLVSTLDLPLLLESWTNLPPLKGVEINGSQKLEAAGDFILDERNTPHFRTTGRVHCENVILKKVPFESVEGAFSLREGDLFLRDLKLVRPDGQAEGKLMIEGPLVRLKLHSTLPVTVYQPFFEGQVLGKILADFTERAGRTVEVMLEGGFDRTNPHAWAYKGQGNVKNMNYKGVPVNTAQCKFSVNHNEFDFYDGTIDFNYSKYALRQTFSGPTSGPAKVGRIRYNAPTKTVDVEDVSGTIWASPMVRLFAPKIADMLEQYRFHRPPELKASGVVDVSPAGRTSLDISFNSGSPADYVFLGENLTLDHPSGHVAIRGSRVTVDRLKLDAFGGPVDARFEYSNGSRLTGELSWTKISIPSIASTYGFQMKGGNATGRIEFSIIGGKVDTMNGDGLLALEKAELFSVPMFGPLSPLIGNVLNNDRAAFQRAKNAFCTFRIKNGILSSNDFQTATTSLNFAGDGSVNMMDRTIDMTMRMNARGLLGIITLPLRPFSGLFQFHGTGTLKDPQWENMKFTAPPDKQNEILLTPPKARIVGEPE